MRAIASFGLAVTLAIATGVTAEDKDRPIDPKKLVGKWEPKEPKKGEKVVLEFTKDQKMVLTVDFEKKTSKYDGTYNVSGNKLAFEIKFGDNDVKQEVTVLKLTDQLLETEDQKGKKESFVKVNAK